VVKRGCVVVVRFVWKVIRMGWGWVGGGVGGVWWGGDGGGWWWGDVGV